MRNQGDSVLGSTGAEFGPNHSKKSVIFASAPCDHSSSLAKAGTAARSKIDCMT